jgi:hypothetical protein
MDIRTADLQKLIHAAGRTWIARTPPPTERHGLGRLPADPQKIQDGMATALLMLEARIGLVPPAPHPQAPGAAETPPVHAVEAVATLPSAATSLPAEMDWRKRGIIGPALDQGWCGSCVSFAISGLVAAMAELELGMRGLTLSAADLHFCSSHGANCSGWDEPEALLQAISRGVVEEAVFPYATAFDNPPQGDPNDNPDHLWIAHCRGEMNRNERRYRVSGYSVWVQNMGNLPFDARKYYLANYGPLVMSFTAYEDFENYAGGIYKHVTGNSRGGHCVLVVGYSDSQKAWICRNSWGVGFGGSGHADGTGDGFFMIAYDEEDMDGTFYACHGLSVPPASRLSQRVGDVDGDGQTEILVTSSWGIGILKRTGSTMTAPMMAPNGSWFGGWMIDTTDSEIGPLADFDGDGRAEILVTSTWGIAILKLSGGTLVPLMIAPNGTRFGNWTLDTSVDEFGPAADYDGDGRTEILVTSPSGLAILKFTGTTLIALVNAANLAQFGGWALDTSTNDFGPAADFDGDGHAELFVTSPWGIGILKFVGNTLTAPMLQPNLTVFGGWALDTSTNSFGEAGDYDGDGQAEILVTSPWGIAILKLAGTTMSAAMIKPNKTWFGGWSLNTGTNQFGPAADYDGDGRVELLVTSSWGNTILKLNGGTMTPCAAAPNGTDLGGWHLNTFTDRLGGAGIHFGAQAELLVASSWGLGILKLSGNSLIADMMQPNGTWLGQWYLDTTNIQL